MKALIFLFFIFLFILLGASLLWLEGEENIIWRYAGIQILAGSIAGTSLYFNY